MPIIETSTYQPPHFYKNAHIETIIPNQFRKVKNIEYQRKRLETPDGDFLDLDFSSANNKTALLLLHGLEGDSQKEYAKGMIKAVNQSGWDGIVMNLRGCSGEPNRLFSAYHSGKTDDLDLVIEYLATQENYDTILLYGVSLGGNIVLKYVGEQGSQLSSKIKAAGALSVPCHLKTSAIELHKRSNWIYLQRFMRKLKRKGIEKIKVHQPPNYNIADFKKARNFYDIDNLYTAPAHGFKDAEDYWEKCHSRQFIPGIKIPTLLVNAQNDTFLSPECYPFEEAKNSKFFHFEAPKHGGHVGFSLNHRVKGEFWTEQRFINFFKELELFD